MTAEREAEHDELGALRLRPDDERRFEEWLSIAADWFWQTDAAGRFTWVSRDTALPAGAVLGRRRQELTEADTEADPAWRAHVADLRAGRPFRDFRYSSRLPGGALRHVSVSGDPVRGADGEIAGWRGVGRDVTAEVDATLRLEESRRRLSAQVALLGRLAAEDPLPAQGLDAALGAVVAAASEALDVRYASVWLVDREADEIFCAAAWDRTLGRPVKRARLKRPGSRASAERLGSDAVLAIDDVEREPAVQAILEQRLRPLGIGAMLDAAIWRDGRLVGNLVLSHVGGPRSWTIEERGLAGSLAAYVARTLEAADRLEAERAMREREERYRVLAEGSVQGLMIAVEHRCVYVNPVFSEITGHTLEDLSGIDALDALAPGHPRLLAFRESRRRGEDPPALRVELPIRRKDGSEMWADCVIKPFRYDGRRASLVSIYDISERKRKQAALEESERRFRELIEGSLQGVTINQGGRMVYANEALCRMFGYPARELVGADRWMLVAPFDLARLKDLLRHGAPERFAFRGRRKDGRLLWLECINRRIEWDGAEAWQVVVMDVTERRLAEEQLLQAQKMEAIGQLTGGVAHDFNNLLAVMLGNLELIRETIALPPTQARMLDSIAGAATRGADLVRSLLAFARRQRLNPERVDLGRVATRALELLGRTLDAGIAIEAKLGDDLHAALVDPALLEAALLNLALNARDAMPEGGRLTVEARNLRLGPADLLPGEDWPPGDYVAVSVADTGSGMTAEVRRRVFEPFFTTKEVGKGTGLGLSMVYGFVAQSGGHIRLSSAPGAGTTFTLLFPRAAPAPAQPSAGEPAGPAGLAGLKVLLVEDDDDVRETALAMLRSFGCEATAFNEGAPALEALRGPAAFDLLLTDVLLPGGLRGPEIAKRAQQLRPGLKCVLMSGYAPQGAPGGPEQPAEGVLAKPFRRAELALALARALAG